MRCQNLAPLYTTHSNPPATSPNFFSTTASENLPTFGSPARLNATVHTMVGPRAHEASKADRIGAVTCPVSSDHV